MAMGIRTTARDLRGRGHMPGRREPHLPQTVTADAHSPAVDCCARRADRPSDSAERFVDALVATSVIWWDLPSRNEHRARSPSLPRMRVGRPVRRGPHRRPQKPRSAHWSSAMSLSPHRVAGSQGGQHQRVDDGLSLPHRTGWSDRVHDRCLWASCAARPAHLLVCPQSRDLHRGWSRWRADPGGDPPSMPDPAWPWCSSRTPTPPHRCRHSAPNWPRRTMITGTALPFTDWVACTPWSWALLATSVIWWDFPSARPHVGPYRGVQTGLCRVLGRRPRPGHGSALLVR